MSDARTKFRQLTQVFDPIFRPYEDAADGPGASYVPETHEGYRKELEAALDLNDSAKLLVAGQPGCGKTTLLRSVAERLRREKRIVAFVDLEVQTAVQDLGSVEMYLAAMAELLAAAKGAGAHISAATLAACRTWLALIEPDREGPADVDAVEAGLRRQLVAVRESRSLRDSLRLLVKESGGGPFELLCRVIEDLRDHRPVVILDGLDKLPPAQASTTFLDDKRKPMADAPGAAVLTIPLSIVYEPTYNVLSGRYVNAGNAVLPAVRLWDLNPDTRVRVRSEGGVKIMRRIVDARVAKIDPGILLPEAVDRAIVGSGGNIRELARLIQASVVKAHVRTGTFVEPQDVERAIADQRESFRRAYDPLFLPVLQRVKREYQLDAAGEVPKQLLYGLWVTEYRNGQAWYSLPTPVEQLLEHLERVAR